MRKLYWYVTAYIKKHGLVVILSVIGAIVVFSATIPSVITNLEQGKQYHIGLVGEHTLNTLPPVVKNQLSAGLTTIEEDGSVSPLLAERWTIEQDGTTYRFVLKEDITWQDGKNLTPEDIQYQLSDVETIITPNDIVFKLPDAFSPFPSVVSEPLLRVSERTKWLFITEPTLIGIGPYTLGDYETNGQRLTKLIVNGPDEKFIYTFFLTEEDAVNAFKHGKVDILPDLVKSHDIMEWSNVTTTAELQTNRYLAVFFNIRNPLFEKNVRQALNYALEKPVDDTRAVSSIDPNSWAYLPGAKDYDKDWERGSERMLDGVPNQPLNLELTTSTLFETEAEQIKQQWEAFGEKVYQDCQNSGSVDDKALCENVKISVTLRITNFPDTSNFQLLLIGQESDPDPDQYQLWHSEQNTNFTGYKNTRIDGLLEKGRQTFDQKERTEIYQEFQQFFLEDAPAIFIKHLNSYRVERE